MPGLVPGIHVLSFSRRKDVDGRAFAPPKRLLLASRQSASAAQRDKPGHDEEKDQLRWRTYSAASARSLNGRPSFCQTSTSASASVSISASSWYGLGVMRSRSVPRGTVG